LDKPERERRDRFFREEGKKGSDQKWGAMPFQGKRRTGEMSRGKGKRPSKGEMISMRNT